MRPTASAAVGVDELARSQHLERDLAGDVAREGDHRRRTEKADIHAIYAEPRAFGRDRHVAGGDKLAASGGGDAVDLGDDGLGQGGDHLHDLGAAGEEIGEIGAALVLGLTARLHLLQIVARAERLCPRP